MQAYAPRPSEANIKFMSEANPFLLLLFEITKSICKKTAPKPSETRSKIRALARVHRSSFSVFPF